MTADRIGLTINDWFKRLEAKHARRAQARKTIKELSNLSDRELRDIGINRYDIPRIAGGRHD
jgi:uncharacterized protein YjiS (DUF1127 family)